MSSTSSCIRKNNVCTGPKSQIANLWTARSFLFLFSDYYLTRIFLNQGSGPTVVEVSHTTTILPPSSLYLSSSSTPWPLRRQEGWMNTFNAVHESRKKISLTGARPKNRGTYFFPDFFMLLILLWLVFKKLKTFRDLLLGNVSILFDRAFLTHRS